MATLNGGVEKAQPFDIALGIEAAAVVSLRRNGLVAALPGPKRVGG
jgi:hypothetical protein